MGTDAEVAPDVDGLEGVAGRAWLRFKRGMDDSNMCTASKLASAPAEGTVLTAVPAVPAFWLLAFDAVPWDRVGVLADRAGMDGAVCWVACAVDAAAAAGGLPSFALRAKLSS